MTGAGTAATRLGSTVLGQALLFHHVGWAGHTLGQLGDLLALRPSAPINHGGLPACWPLCQPFPLPLRKQICPLRGWDKAAAASSPLGSLLPQRIRSSVGPGAGSQQQHPHPPPSPRAAREREGRSPVKGCPSPGDAKQVPSCPPPLPICAQRAPPACRTSTRLISKTKGSVGCQPWPETSRAAGKARGDCQPQLPDKKTSHMISVLESK